MSILLVILAVLVLVALFGFFFAGNRVDRFVEVQEAMPSEKLIPNQAPVALEAKFTKKAKTMQNKGKKQKKARNNSASQANNAPSVKAVDSAQTAEKKQTTQASAAKQQTSVSGANSSESKPLQKFQNKANNIVLAEPESVQEYIEYDVSLPKIRTEVLGYNKEQVDELLLTLLIERAELQQQLRDVG